MKKNVLIILTIGLILRVFLAASTYHADVAALGFAGKVVSEGNVLNLYDYLSGLPAGHPYLNIYPTNLFIYPPPIYFLYGGLFSLIRGIFGADFINIFIANPLSLFGEVKLSFFLLFLKLPLFIFDIATAFLLMLLFFIFTHYHPQWFLWITPFPILDLVESRLKSFPLILLSLLSWIGLVTFFDPGLSTRLFAPIIPSLGNLPGIWQILGLDININLARSYFQTIFAAVGFYYLYKYFPVAKGD